MNAKWLKEAEVAECILRERIEAEMAETLRYGTFVPSAPESPFEADPRIRALLGLSHLLSILNRKV